MTKSWKRQQILILVCALLQGIEWTNIEYFNNAIICDLIENVSQVKFILNKNTLFIWWCPHIFIQKLYIVFKI